MKFVCLFVLILSSGVFAQDRDYHIGDRAKKTAYSLGCKESEAFGGGEMLLDRSDAVAKGYTIAAKCTPFPKPQSPKAVKPFKPISLIQILSDVISYDEKDLSVRASLRIGRSYNGNFTGMEKVGYAFEIYDDTGSMTVYMDRNDASARLRQILLTTGRGNDVVGDLIIWIPKTFGTGRNYQDEAVLMSYSNLKVWAK